MPPNTSGDPHETPRSGTEPATARSPLRLRLALAIFGAAAATTGAVIFGFRGYGWPTFAFAVIAALACLNIAVVVVRIRQGQRFQPGPDVPPQTNNYGDDGQDRRKPRP